MKTFFWGFFPKPWKRLFRTISIIIILIFSTILYESRYESDRIICIVILITIPILSYVIEPFVLDKKINQPKKDSSPIINNEPIITISDKTNNSEIVIEKVGKTEKSKLLNYFTFNDEYLNGISYLNRMIISWVTTIIFGIGLYLMLTTIYKRSKSLGFSKVLSIIYCVTIPSMLLLTFLLIFLENSETDFSDINIFKSILFRLLLGLPHLILLFKNGTRKKIGKFEIHE